LFSHACYSRLTPPPQNSPDNVCYEPGLTEVQCTAKTVNMVSRCEWNDPMDIDDWEFEWVKDCCVVGYKASLNGQPWCDAVSAAGGGVPLFYKPLDDLGKPIQPAITLDEKFDFTCDDVKTPRADFLAHPDSAVVVPSFDANCCTTEKFDAATGCTPNSACDAAWVAAKDKDFGKLETCSAADQKVLDDIEKNCNSGDTYEHSDGYGDCWKSGWLATKQEYLGPCIGPDKPKVPALEQEILFCAEAAAVCNEMTDACLVYVMKADFSIFDAGCAKCDAGDGPTGADIAEKCPVCAATITQLSKKCTASKVVEIKVEATMEVAGLTAETIPAAGSPAMELLADSLAATIAKSITAAPGSTVEVISIGGVMVGGGMRRRLKEGAEIFFEVSQHAQTRATQKYS